MDDSFSRTAALIGKDGLQKLQNSSVAVFGLGGVGSFAAEALARSGVGTLYIYDSDVISQSNRNRQLIADRNTVGKEKTAVQKERLLSVSPALNVYAETVFLNRETSLPFEKFDFMVDAVDNVTAKLFLAEKSKELGVPLISVMGTGNKLLPEKLKISDIFETSGCPLCRVMRKELSKLNIDSLAVVWSDEAPIEPKASSGERATGRPNPASMIFVPGSAGLIAASYVVRNLLEK